MNIGLFEDAGYRKLLPLTWLRACFELRCGRDLLIDKVHQHVSGRVARLWLRETVREVVHERTRLESPTDGADWCAFNGRALVTADVAGPPLGTAWTQNGELVAATVKAADAGALRPELFQDEKRLAKWLKAFRIESPPSGVRLIEYPWGLVQANPGELNRQCRRGGTAAGNVHSGAHLLNQGAIHIAEGVVVKPGAVLDAEEGPIHIDHGAVIQPNAVLQGPCFIGAGSIVRPGASIRGGTTIGPVCKVGGEIEASIIQGYSNKQHDGFLGHSYVGQWVNLGADSITSDLKNTYGTIRVSLNGTPVETGQHFVGSFIGDHSKTGIGTILPTGCVLGVLSNVFTLAPLPKFVPSFAWLTDAGLEAYHVEKAVRIAELVMGRRDVHLSDAEARLVQQTAKLSREVEKAGWV